MNRRFFLQLVFANALKKRLRSMLVVCGISASIAVIIMLAGVNNGLRATVNRQAQSTDSRDVVTVHERSLQQVQFNQESIARIGEISGVGQVERSVGAFGNLEREGASASVATYGLSKDFFSVSQLSFVNGSGKELQGQAIVLSKRTLELLRLTPNDAVGKTINVGVNITKSQNSEQVEEVKTLPPQTFTIAGVVEKEVATAYIPIAYLEQHGVNRVSELRFHATSMSRIASVREAIEQMGFQTKSVQDTLSQIDKIFSIIQRALGVFTLLVLLITISGTFTIVSLTLLEETRMIGFLRVNGARSRDVKMLFLLQAILLTTLGTVVGIALGLCGGAAMNVVARSAAHLFEQRVRVFHTPVREVVVLMLASLGVGWCIGIVPAQRAVNMRPLEELRA